jgi:hypothetical protein
MIEFSARVLFAVSHSERSLHFEEILPRRVGYVFEIFYLLKELQYQSFSSLNQLSTIMYVFGMLLATMNFPYNANVSVLTGVAEEHEGRYLQSENRRDC